MEQETEADVRPSDDHQSLEDTQSLGPLRVVAALGAVVSVALVVVGFMIGFWFGLAAIVLVPVVPMVFVLLTEAIRRNRG